MITLSVSSFKGGTAKTSSCLHIASSLALHHNFRVLVVDFDAQANLTSGLGFDVDQYDSIASALQKSRPVDEVILETSVKGLDLIPADIWLERIEVTGSLATDRYSHERLKTTLKPLSNRYDFVFIDTPPSLCWLTESALIASDYALVCATPEFYSVKGLQRLSSFLQTMGERHSVDVLGVCLSFWNPRGKNNQAFLEVIEENFPGALCSTKVRKDVAITEAAIMGKPAYLTHPRSRATEDFTKLTKELVEKLVKSKKKPVLKSQKVLASK